MVVTRAEEKLRGRYPQFSHVLYAERIRLLANKANSSRKETFAT